MPQTVARSIMNFRSYFLLGSATLVAWVLVVACGGSGAAVDDNKADASGGNSVPAPTGSSTDNPPAATGGNPTTYDAAGPGPGTTGTFACGTSQCTAPQTCCATNDGGTCIGADQACSGGIKVTCDDITDCPADQKCCAGYFNVGCAPSCDFFSVQLCQTTAECGDAGPCSDKDCKNVFTQASYKIRSCGAPPPNCQ